MEMLPKFGCVGASTRHFNAMRKVRPLCRAKHVPFTPASTRLPTRPAANVLVNSGYEESLDQLWWHSGNGNKVNFFATVNGIVGLGRAQTITTPRGRARSRARQMPGTEHYVKNVRTKFGGIGTAGTTLFCARQRRGRRKSRAKHAATHQYGARVVERQFPSLPASWTGLGQSLVVIGEREPSPRCATANETASVRGETCYHTLQRSPTMRTAIVFDSKLRERASAKV